MSTTSHLCLITCTHNVTAAECGERSASDGNFFNYCRLCSSPYRLCRFCPTDKRNLVPAGREDGLCKECLEKTLKRTGSQWTSPAKKNNRLSVPGNGNKTKKPKISQTQAQILINEFCIEKSTRVEIAKFVQKLFECGLGNTTIAKLMAKSEGWVVSHRNLLKLPNEVLELAESNSLIITVALLLLKIPEKNKQIELANKAAKESWTIRKTEDEVYKYLAQR